MTWPRGTATGGASLRRRGRCLTVLVLMAAVAAARADDPEPPRAGFLRVHVPAGRLGDVPLGGGRYVPMSLAEFDAAVAQAAAGRKADGAEEPTPLVATVRYEAAIGDGGELAGTLSFDVVDPPASREVPLGAVTARGGTFTGDGASRDAVIFGTVDGRSAMQAAEPGRYACDFVCRRAGGGPPSYLLPLVPAVVAAIELRLPADLRPLVSGPAARRAVITSPEQNAGVWRIAIGPATEIGITVVPRAAEPARLAIWSDLAVRGEQADLVATLRPDGPWTASRLSLGKDAAVRVTAVRAEGDDLPLAMEESADGLQLSILLPAWVQGSRVPLVVRGVTPGTGAAWRLPLVRPTTGRWAGGGETVTVDPARAIAAIDLDGARVVTPEVAARWPMVERAAVGGIGAEGMSTNSMRPSTVHVEQQAEAADVVLTLRPRSATIDVARVTTVEIGSRAVTARAACDVKVVEGEVFDLVARLAPGWIPDSVELVDWPDAAGRGEPSDRGGKPEGQTVEWRLAASPGGDALRIGLALGATPRRRVGLRITGHRSPIPPDATFLTADIDMVRLDGESAGSSLIDIRTAAESFVEIDGQPAGVLPAEGRLAPLVEAGPVRGRIAGGDLNPVRKARVVRRRPPLEARVEVRLEPREEMLAETFAFACRPEAGSVESLVIDFSEPGGEELAWSVESPAGVTVVARPWSAGEAENRPAAIAESWLVELNPAVQGPITLRAARVVPFVEPVRVPLAWVAGAREAVGAVRLAGSGPRRPEFVNHRLVALPANSSTDETSALPAGEFAYGPPASSTEPAAELRPRAAGGDARAWAWREEVSCWCDEDGSVECESRFDIENEGREFVVVSVLPGRRVQGISVGTTAVPVDAVGQAGGTLRIPLPADGHRLVLAVRTVSRSPSWLGGWWVDPAGCALDLPVLERDARLLLPPGLEIAATAAASRVVDPVRRGWLERLAGGPFGATVDEDSGDVARGGFRSRRLAAGTDRTAGGVLLVRQRFVLAASLLAAVVCCGIGFMRVGRAPAAVATICLAAATAALWAEPPFHAVARAACWAVIVGAAARGIAAAVPRWRRGVRRTAVASIAVWVVTASVVRADEPDAYRVFITPSAEGEMALVPEPLFRILGGGPRSRAAAIRVMRCDLVAGDAADGSSWRMTLDLDADAGGVLSLRQEPGLATWLPPAAPAPGSGLAVRLDDGLVRIAASTAGRHRVELAIMPQADRRDGVEQLVVRIPPAPTATLRVAEEPSGGWTCDRATGGGPFVPVAATGLVADASFHDVAGADRVRLVRPLEPGQRFAAQPAFAATTNAVTWDLDSCRVDAAFEIDGGDGLLRSITVRADDRLGRIEAAVAGGMPARIESLGDGRLIVRPELPLAGRQRIEVAARMPVADPVGVFEVPTLWLADVAHESRTLSLEAAADLEAILESAAPRGESAADLANRPAPRVEVQRRWQQPRGAQSLTVTFAETAVGLALRVQVDATSVALDQLLVDVPPGCVVDRVAMAAEDLLTGLASDPVDLAWTRKAADQLVVVMQQPRAGRFRLEIDARLRMRPPVRGRVPLARVDLAGGAPLAVTCVGDPASRLAVKAGDAAGIVEVFPREPAPEYVLEPVPTAAVVPPPAVPAPAATESRVDGMEVFAAFDGRGRVRGAIEFDVVGKAATLQLRLPAGLRLFDVRVDGEAVAAVPRAADHWELPLGEASWPRRVLAVFAGEVGPAWSAGRPTRLEPPAVEGLPAPAVIWTLVAPPGSELRVDDSLRLLDTAELHALRAETRGRIADAFAAALVNAEGQQRERLALLAETRRAAAGPPLERGWKDALGWPTLAHAPRGVHGTAAAAAALAVRVVRRPDATISGRAAATGVAVLAAMVAWGLAARRRPAEPPSPPWVAPVVVEDSTATMPPVTP